MRGRLTTFALLGVALVFALLFARQLMVSHDLPREQYREKKLRLLTYSSFLGAMGPGEEILKRFEKECDCKVEVTTAGDAGLLLERLKVAQVGVPFDVVLGFDQLSVPAAKRDFKWKIIPEDRAIHAPEAAYTPEPEFAVLDWAPLTFIYRQDEAGPVPKNLDELLKKELQNQLALQDPHTSSPGLQFYHWIKALKKEQTLPWLQRFRPNVNSISPSWSLSYGRFMKKQARFVFSYLTSLAYHWDHDRDRRYQALIFPEGHPIQVELMGIPETCQECELAQSFVHAVQSDWAQSLVMKMNYMFPVRGGLVPGTIFAELPRIKTIPTDVGKELSDWDKVFSHSH